MNIDIFKNKLKSGTVKFSYTKKDGTVRFANGTLCKNLISQDNVVHKNSKKKIPDGIVIYYDLDKSGFRSFNESQLIEFEM